MKRKEQLKKYRKMSLASLFKAEAKLKRKIFEARTKLSVGKLKNTAQIKNLRKELARVKTIIREKAAQELRAKEKSKDNTQKMAEDKQTKKKSKQTKK